MTTLRQVAERAGVSAKTVSRVVNGEAAVHAETRASILKIVKELGYVPNAAARSMRTAESRVIGFLTDAVVTQPHSVDLVSGAQAEARGGGRTMLIGNTGGSAELEDEYWRLLRSHRAEGALFAAHYHRAVSIADDDFGAPVVLLNCYDPVGRHAAVLPDDCLGGWTQANHLLKLGHRRIGVISLNPVIRAAALRQAGMANAFRDAGVRFDEGLLRAGAEGEPGKTEHFTAHEAAFELLQLRDRPTALICGNDQIAMFALQAALALGLKVPDDLSIIGFDDLKLFSETARPQLTTVALPYFEIGRRAMGLLTDVLKTGDAAREPDLVRCPLVERGSCRRVA